MCVYMCVCVYVRPSLILKYLYLCIFCKPIYVFAVFALLCLHICFFLCSFFQPVYLDKIPSEPFKMDEPAPLIEDRCEVS